MTCTDGVMKSCDTLSVGSTRIVHLRGGERRRSELRNLQALFHSLNFKRKKRKELKTPKSKHIKASRTQLSIPNENEPKTAREALRDRHLEDQKIGYITNC